jgi:predicted DsbA family dithiol-disulfide isomerase
MTLSMTFYSDVLCVWAYISQARVDEVQRRFSDRVAIDYRFCSVFGDTAYKIEQAWADRGGYEAFGLHIRDAAAAFGQVRVHEDIWRRSRPPSSAPAHLALKAVQRLENDLTEPLLRAIRRAFFEECQNIADWRVLQSCMDAAEVPVDRVREIIDSGLAFADLEADSRDRGALMVQGSPTFILNDGRQKLYGNIGYGVIEANINELLREPHAGAASWC